MEAWTGSQGLVGQVLSTRSQGPSSHLSCFLPPNVTGREELALQIQASSFQYLGVVMGQPISPQNSHTEFGVRDFKEVIKLK